MNNFKETLTEKLMKHFDTEIELEWHQAIYEDDLAATAKVAEMLNADTVDFGDCYIAKPFGAFDEGAFFIRKGVKYVVKTADSYYATVPELTDAYAPDILVFIDVDTDKILGYADLHYVKREQVVISEHETVYVKFVPEALDIDKYKKPSRKGLLSKSDTADIMAFANCKLVDTKVSNGLVLAAMLHEYFFNVKLSKISGKRLTVLQKLYFAIHLPMLQKPEIKLSPEFDSWRTDMVNQHYDVLNAVNVKKTDAIANWLKTAESIQTELVLHNRILLKVLKVDIEQQPVSLFSEIVKYFSKTYDVFYELIESLDKKKYNIIINLSEPLIQPLNLTPNMGKTKLVSKKKQLEINAQNLQKIVERDPEQIRNVIEEVKSIPEADLDPAEKKLMLDYFEAIARAMGLSHSQE